TTTAITALSPFGPALPFPRMPPPAATAVASGRPLGSVPVDANVLRSRSSSSTLTRPPPCPVAPWSTVSLLLIAQEAQPSPYRAKIRAVSGQRSVTEAMVMSGVIASATGLLRGGASLIEVWVGVAQED